MKLTKLQINHITKTSNHSCVILNTLRSFSLLIIWSIKILTKTVEQ